MIDYKNEKWIGLIELGFVPNDDFLFMRKSVLRLEELKTSNSKITETDRELFEKAHHRLVNTLFGAFSVNREKPQGSTFRTALLILRAGGAVTLFPEGGIVDTLGQKGFKAGVGTLATMSGASIQPIYINILTFINVLKGKISNS